MFDLGPQPRRRRPSLTPMIDVVFLLLVFFMLAARFGMDTTLSLAMVPTGVSTYNGAPRLIEVAPNGALFLNGTALQADTLVTRLEQLLPTPADIVVLRPRMGAQSQDLVDVLLLLRAAQITNVKIVEGKNAF
ncbi:MAG: biopolymer transporter ExbD [Rhodobacteraceae bacterium]|jgi:biopolymer transport protein ExbD|nr:biopolymer transporter ExbD [Paracoccaceae bacterium]